MPCLSQHSFGVGLHGQTRADLCFWDMRSTGSLISCRIQGHVKNVYIYSFFSIYVLVLFRLYWLWMTLGKMKGRFIFWTTVAFVLPAVQHGVCVVLFHTDPYRVKGGSTVRFFPLHHASFHLIKWAFWGRHVHSKIGRKRGSMKE